MNSTVVKCQTSTVVKCQTSTVVKCQSWSVTITNRQEYEYFDVDDSNAASSKVVNSAAVDSAIILDDWLAADAHLIFVELDSMAVDKLQLLTQWYSDENYHCIRRVYAALRWFGYKLIDDFCRHVKKIWQDQFEDVLINKPDSWIWHYVSNNTAVSEEFFEKHLGEIGGANLILNSNLSADFFKRHIEHFSISELSSCTKLPEDFFEQHLTEVDWYQLSGNTGISEEFFERHIDKVRWEQLSKNVRLSDSFYERHIEWVEWDYICINTSVSESFFERHIGLVN